MRHAGARAHPDVGPVVRAAEVDVGAVVLRGEVLTRSGEVHTQLPVGAVQRVELVRLLHAKIGVSRVCQCGGYPNLLKIARLRWTRRLVDLGPFIMH